MGFHVDLEELHKAANKLNQEASRIETQLTDAKNSVNKIITSEALQGKTGQAIYQQLNNVDAAVLVGLADTSKVMASEFSSLLSSFHSSVGETSNSAVLDEDYLNQLKDNLNNFKNQHGAQEENISSIYASISDLISLSGPQSNYDADSDTASQLLSTTIDKVTSFDSSGTAPTSADLLAAIDTEVNQVSQTTDLPYTDSQYLSFINDVNFAKGIKSVDKQLTEQEKLAKEQAEQKARKEWAKHHPVEALLQNVNDETTKLFKWANQEVQDFNLNIPGGNYVKDQISLRLGFISKACETIGDLALGATQLSHLTVESIQWGANGQKTAQWIKDDVTSAGMTILTTDIFIKQLQHGDIDAWKAVYKGIENSASQVFHNITSGNTFEIGGYLFDVATLVGPAAVGKLKYVDEASNLAKLAKTEEVASTIGKVEDDLSLSFEKLMSAEDTQKYIQWNKYAEAGIEPEGRVKLLEISENAPKTEYMPGRSEENILKIAKGRRPKVENVYSPEFINEHQQQFSNGAIKIQKFTPTENGFNNGAIGNPKDHVAFVMPKDVGETIIEVSKGNPRILEDILGLHSGDLGDSPVAIDIPPESIHNLKIPSGNENSAFEGFWRPGGRTYPGDMPEAVIDEVPWGEYTIRTLGGK
nr:T7SS effector LXG polymorphic toxin [Streptococcus lutetiensis]